jgi:hypothetical protein
VTFASEERGGRGWVEGGGGMELKYMTDLHGGSNHLMGQAHEIALLDMTNAWTYLNVHKLGPI